MVSAKRLTPRRVLMWFLLLMLFAALVYAATELLGQTNKSAADAGSTGADMEMATLESIKPSKSKPAKPSEQQRLLSKIRSIDREYKALVNKARSETMSTSHVSPATRSAGVACANRYQQASEEYAAYWERNGNPKQANVAHQTGLARVKNADMVFNDVDSSKISDYNDQQDKVAKARREYLAEAKGDLSDADRAALKSTLLPRLQKMTGEVTSLVSQITSLLNQARSAAGGNVGAIGGCAKQLVSGGIADGPAGLIAPLTSLLSLTKGLGNNIGSMISDVTSL